jgi:hypothetical protein
MVPKDNIARTPISTGSFLTSSPPRREGIPASSALPRRYYRSVSAMTDLFLPKTTNGLVVPVLLRLLRAVGHRSQSSKDTGRNRRRHFNALSEPYIPGLKSRGSTGSNAVKSYLAGTGAHSLGGSRSDATDEGKLPPKFARRQELEISPQAGMSPEEKIPGSGGADPGTGVRDAGPKTFLNFAAVSNSSGALPAKRETQVGWPSPALCRETRSLSGA